MPIERSLRVHRPCKCIAAGVIALAGAGCLADLPPDDATAPAQAAVQGAPILVSPRASAISEAGDPAFFRVTLAARPRGRVTLAIASSDPAEARVVPAVVSFTPSNWSTPQTITAIAVDDDAFDGDVAIQLVLSPAESPDPDYAGYQVPPLDVLSVDDDYVITGYRARELVTEGVIESRVAALNNRGQVAGDMLKTDGVIHPFLWDRGSATDLGSLGGGHTQSHALDVNDAGVVLGWSDTLEGVTRFLYQGGQLSPTPGEVWAINDRGHTVGDALYADGQRIEIPDLDDQPAMGLALSNRDHVAGYAPVPPFHQHAFFWTGGEPADLGTFGGPIGAGLGVNEHDQVVGRMFDPQINHRPFLYESGQPVDLGTATGTPGGIASSINNRGDIVGTDLDSAGMPETGWIGRPGDLRSLKALLVDGSCFFMIEAIDVNDRGQIAANGRDCTSGTIRAYLLEPVKGPKPAL